MLEIEYQSVIYFQEIGRVVKKIEPEKVSKTKEAESFLRSSPKCASAPQLYSKVDDADKKYNKVDLLLKLSEEKYVPLT